MAGMPAPPHLAIIGLGAIGNALLPMVACQGFGHITLVDGDTIEKGNLVRQPLYGSGDIGRFKVDVAVERTAHLHLERKVTVVRAFLDQANIAALLHAVDLVADCMDDLHARKLLDSTCAELGLPLVSGAVHGDQLQVSTAHVSSYPGINERFQGRATTLQDGCDMRNVPITATVITAALMAQRLGRFLHHAPADPFMDLLDVSKGQWLRIAPPLPPEDDQLIA